MDEKAIKNQIENVDYILIPGGTFKFSVTEKQENVQPLYFCKYMVTNKRYEKFYYYLHNEKPQYYYFDEQLEKKLPSKLFCQKLREFLETLRGYNEYCENERCETFWPTTLLSITKSESKNKFKTDSHPVVNLTWYAAKSYCFWLSCLEAADKGDEKLQNIDKISQIYRLPTEIEWEWAAAGREENGTLRPYPWGKEWPRNSIVSCYKSIRSTTPVGQYHNGATPEGLMDMAGNALEWTESNYSKDKPFPALRGSSWENYIPERMLCSSREFSCPSFSSNLIGFRVVREAHIESYNNETNHEN